MSRSFEYLDPGPLVDAELELVPPAEQWLDAVMAAQQDILSRELMPAVAAITRERQERFLRSLSSPAFNPGDVEGGLSPSYHFWMRRRGDGELPIVGGIGLRLGDGGHLERVIGHLGYQVYPFARGHRYAERACRLLLPLARRQGMRMVWITCNPDNAASRRTCQRLGAELVDVVAVPHDHPSYARGEREKCRYRLDVRCC